jgi:hypothetical protein
MLRHSESLLDPCLLPACPLPPQSDDLSPVLDALGEALGSPQVLCSLTVWAGAYFVLPTGAVVPAQLLVAGGEARQQLGQRCRGAEVDLVEGDDTHWLVLSWPAAAEQH